MAGLGGSGDWACGHPALPGAQFCPVCGRPTTGHAWPPATSDVRPQNTSDVRPQNTSDVWPQNTSDVWPPNPGDAWPPQPLTAPLPAADAVPAAWPPPESPPFTPPPRPEPAPWDSWYKPRQPSPPPAGPPEPWPVPPAAPPVPPAAPPEPWAAPSGSAPPLLAGPEAMWAADPVDSPTEMLDGLRLTPAAGAPRLESARPRASSGGRSLGSAFGGLTLGSALGRLRQPGRRLYLGIVAAVVVAVVGGIVIVQALSGGRAAGSTTGSTASASSPGAQRQAAVQLAGLLAQSVTDRAAVTAAAEDVRACGPSLPQDARTFTREASSRQQLLSRLAGLPGRSRLPAAMLQDLTSAWQASAEVDTDLAQWTQDNIARHCRHGSRSDAHLRASSVPEARATVAKRAFAARWNPIARKYGLTTYQRTQL